MIRSSNVVGGLVVGILLAGGGIVLGAYAQQSGPPDFSPAAREKMAEVHERMATCLKSDKPLAQCRSEMLKNCQDFMGTDGCPMMGPWGGGMGPGMGNRMMPGPPVNQRPAK